MGGVIITLLFRLQNYRRLAKSKLCFQLSIPIPLRPFSSGARNDAVATRRRELTREHRGGGAAYGLPAGSLVWLGPAATKLTDRSGQIGVVRYRYTGLVWPETGRYRWKSNLNSNFAVQTVRTGIPVGIQIFLFFGLNSNARKVY